MICFCSGFLGHLISACVSLQASLSLYNVFFFPRVVVGGPPHSFSPVPPHSTNINHRVLWIHHSVCKTSSSRTTLFNYDIPSHQEPCSTFCSMPSFCIFDGALVGEEEGGGTVERRKMAGFLYDACCVITAGSPEETQTDQCESRLDSYSGSPGLDIISDFKASACCTVHCLPFEAASILHHCTVLFWFPSLRTATIHIQYINRRAKWVTSRWSQKPVDPQSELLNERSAAVYSELSCC